MARDPSHSPLFTWRHAKPRIFAVAVALIGAFLVSTISTFVLVGIVGPAKTGINGMSYVTMEGGVPEARIKGNPSIRHTITRSQYEEWNFYQHLAFGFGIFGGACMLAAFPLVVYGSMSSYEVRPK